MVKTYLFSLRSGSLTKQQYVRAESREAAMSELEPDLRYGWIIEHVAENGDPISIEP